MGHGRNALLIPFVLVLGLVAVAFLVLSDLWDIHQDRKGVRKLKFKDMVNLSREVQKAASFAEQIKAKVTDDLKRITEMKTFIDNNAENLMMLSKRLTEAEKTLNSIQELIE